MSRTSYDEVPYRSFPFGDTHPDSMATVAKLLNLNPPPIDKCRVLELGCASGGNLLPMAELLPESTFLGIDLSEVQIADGHKTVAATEMTNVELRHASILDVTPAWGQFDYIVCHGVYTWVPNEVQDKILTICKENLSPNGIGYVSYNTLPGWHMRGMIRDMMRFHARRFTTPQQKTTEARALLDFLVKASGNDNTAYATLLKTELEILRQAEDWYLYHEHLEEINEPIYFHQFAERLAAKNLRFVGESSLRLMVPGNYPPEIEQVLQRVSSDIVSMEQFLDFLRNRVFRQSLITHDAHTPVYQISPDRLAGMYLTTPAKPESPNPDLTSTEPLAFPLGGKATMTIRDPMVKAAVTILGEMWPRAVRFESLCDQARRRLNPAMMIDEGTRQRDATNLGRSILQMYTSTAAKVLEIRTRPVEIVVEVSEKPIVSPLVRHQAVVGNAVTNRRHETAQLGPFERQVLRRLDGQHDKPTLITILVELVGKNELKVQENNQVVTEPVRLRELIGKALDETLNKCAQLAYLIQ